MKATLITGWINLETEATLKLDVPYSEWYFSNPLWKDENGNRIPKHKRNVEAKISLNDLKEHRSDRKIEIDITLALMQDRLAIDTNNNNLAQDIRHQVKIETVEISRVRIDMKNATIQLIYSFIEYDKEGNLCPPSIVSGKTIQFRRNLNGNVYKIYETYNSEGFGVSATPEGFYIPW